jgi:hypothetical protein
VSAPSKPWICGHSHAGIVGSNPAGCLSLMSVVFCHVQVSAKDRTLFQRSPTKRGVSENDRKASTMRRPWPTGGCCAMGVGENCMGHAERRTTQSQWKIVILILKGNKRRVCPENRCADPPTRDEM